MRALGYTRISRQQRGRPDPYGVAAQERAIRSWAEVGGHELVGIESDVASGRSTRRRPGFESALGRLPDEAEVLVVGKLDRLSRSTLDFAGLVERSQREGWAIAVLDVGVDLTTPHGRLVAGVLASVAQWERELIGERTREALAEAKASGTRVGRAPSVSADVVSAIEARRREGWTLARIADWLNTDGVPTGHGGRQWWPSTVRGVMRRASRT